MLISSGITIRWVMFMKSRFKYEEVGVHPRVFLDGQEGRFTKDIVHKGYPDFELQTNPVATRLCGRRGDRGLDSAGVRDRGLVG